MDSPKKLFSTKEKEVLSSADLITPDNLVKSPELSPSDKELNKETIKSAESIVSSSQKKSATALSQPSSTPQSSSAKLAQTVVFKKIEAILEEDLEELYFKMDETHRRIFKEEGEKTAHQIEQVIITSKSIAFKIVELIKHWLNFIPGLNKFFVDQAAKIKADKIIKTLKH